jgi:hypothetical protein
MSDTPRAYASMLPASEVGGKFQKRFLRTTDKPWLIQASIPPSTTTAWQQPPPVRMPAARLARTRASPMMNKGSVVALFRSRSFLKDQPENYLLLGDLALRESMRKLPGAIYRAKGMVHTSGGGLLVLIGPIEANARSPKHMSNTSSHDVGNDDHSDQAKEEQQSVLCFWPR